VSRPALGPTQPPVQGVPGRTFPRAKARLGCDADNSPHLVPRSWMSRSYSSSPPLRLRKCVVELLYLHITNKCPLGLSYLFRLELFHTILLNSSTLTSSRCVFEEKYLPNLKEFIFHNLVTTLTYYQRLHNRNKYVATKGQGQELTERWFN
jgi:hypothetical protein